MSGIVTNIYKPKKGEYFKIIYNDNNAVYGICNTITYDVFYQIKSHCVISFDNRIDNKFSFFIHKKYFYSLPIFLHSKLLPLTQEEIKHFNGLVKDYHLYRNLYPKNLTLGTYLSTL